jgi:hypothetical protein
MSELPVPTDSSTLHAAPADSPTGLPDVPGASGLPGLPGLSRRGFLRASAVTGVGVAAAAVAACAPAPGWTFPPAAASAIPSGGPEPSSPAAASASPDAGHSMAPGASPMPSMSPGALPGGVTLPPGWSDHDLAGQVKIRRFVGKLAEPLGLGPFLKEPLGPPTNDPEFMSMPQGNVPLEPRIDGDAKVFELTVDAMSWPIDGELPPVDALGYNAMWPGPVLRVTQGDRVRAVFKNNLEESTGVHFHGVQFTDFYQDGVPFVTQLPIVPGETYTYDFVAPNSGSHMYHSHHNATDQVGRGLLGAFIVDPADPAERYDRKHGVTQEVVFIHNDALGGFTINGHGFPATTPILAKRGERVLIRFMNEGTMMHPWHTHGFHMEVVARDGEPLGTAAFRCDTLGVNPGERWDAIVEVDRNGVWAFHCHILPHVEGLNGMFGMVTAIVVTD